MLARHGSLGYDGLALLRRYLFSTDHKTIGVQYGVTSLFFLLVGFALVPIAVAANYLGIWSVRKVSTEAFFKIAYVLMFLIAVELMRSSIIELWWR